jgi:hypothetical protein
MWRSSLARLVTALALGVGAGWAGSGGGVPHPLAAQVVNPLPLDPDQQFVTGRCVICHSLEMIAQQRQTRDEWTVIVDRMITYGMPMGPGDRERMLSYLVKHLGQ